MSIVAERTIQIHAGISPNPQRQIIHVKLVKQKAETVNLEQLKKAGSGADVSNISGISISAQANKICAICAIVARTVVGSGAFAVGCTIVTKKSGTGANVSNVASIRISA